MKLKYLFYLEVLIGMGSALACMIIPKNFVATMDVFGLTGAGLVFIQWYGVLLFAFTLILALTLYKESLEALKIIFIPYAIGDILHIGVTALLAMELANWNFAAFFGIGFTLLLFAGRLTVLNNTNTIGFSN